MLAFSRMRWYTVFNNESIRTPVDVENRPANGKGNEMKSDVIHMNPSGAGIAEALIEYETLTSEQIEKVIRGESIEADFRDQHKAEKPIAQPEEQPAEKPAAAEETAAGKEEKPENEAGE